VLPAWLAVLLLLKALMQVQGLVKPVSSHLPESVGHPRFVAILLLVVVCFLVGVIIRTTIGRHARASGRCAGDYDVQVRDQVGHRRGRVARGAAGKTFVTLTMDKLLASVFGNQWLVIGISQQPLLDLKTNFSTPESQTVNPLPNKP